MKNKVHSFLIRSLTAMVLGSLLVFTGCENFMGGQDIVEELENIIDYANATPHTIRVRADENTGTIISNRDNDVKVTDEFEIAFQVAQGYKFIRWAAVNREDNVTPMDDYVKIENPETIETKVSFLKESDNILIKPLCEVVYKVTGTSVSNADAVYSRDTAISITFNYPPVPENDLSKIAVTISGLTDALNYFETPVIKENTVYFFPKEDNLIPVALDSNRTVTVTVPEEIYYKGSYSDVALDASYSFSYVIDSSTTEKTSITYIYNEEAGSLKVNGEVPGAAADRYSIGQSINLVYKKNSDYYFNGWQITDSEGKNASEVLITYPDNEATYGYDEATSIATATLLILKPVAGITVAPSVTLIPTASVQFSLDDELSGVLKVNGITTTGLPSDYKKGTVITATFKNNSDYTFNGWSCSEPDTGKIVISYPDNAETFGYDAETKTSTINILVNGGAANVVIKPVAPAIPTASIRFLLDDEKSGTLKVDGITSNGSATVYKKGTVISVTFKKNADYYFEGWSCSDSSIALLSYSDNITEYGYDKNTETATMNVTVNGASDDIVIKPDAPTIPTAVVKMVSSHGRSNPVNEDATPYKEKLVNNITFEADNGYFFTKWIAKNSSNPSQDVSEYISIDKPDLQSTTFTVLKEAPEGVNLVITPDCIERGEFISATPALSPEGSFRDAPIQVMFDHDMDADSIYYTETELTDLRGKGVTAFKTTDIKGVTKYYGYTMNGQIFYKNITITNFLTGANLLSSYGAPYFSTPKVLMIPTAYILNEDSGSRTILAPAAGTQIMVTVNADCFFRDEKYNKPISMKGSKIWTYLVNTKTDSLPPTFTVDIKNHDNTQIEGYIPTSAETSPVGNTTEYSKIFIQDKLLRYSVTFADTGCGIGSEFIRKIQKVADSSYNPISPLPEAVSDTISIFSADPANFVYSPEPMDLSSYTDGIYEVSFEMADKNNNIGYSETSMRYFFLLDSISPNVEEPKLESLSGKIKLVWNKCEETDFSKTELKVDDVAKSTDVANLTDITTYDGSTKTYTKEFTFAEGTKHKFEFNFYDLAGNNKQYVITKNTIPGKVSSISRNSDIGTNGNEIIVNWNYPDTTEGKNNTYSKARIFYTTGSEVPSKTTTTFVDVEKKAAVTSDSYPFENLALGTTYNFIVYAVDDDGNLSIDAPAYVTKNTKPNKIASRVTGTSSIVSDKNQIKLDWTNPAGNVAETVLYYGNTGENFTESDTNTADSGKFEISGSANAAGTKTITDLKPGKKYYFNLYVKDGENQLSDVAKFNKNTLPGEVQSASVSYPLDDSSNAVKTKIKVDWINPDTINGINSTYTKARIYYSASGTASTSSQYVEVNKDTTSYTFENLALGSTYNFKVYAVDDEGNLSPEGVNAGTINTQPNKIPSYTLATNIDVSDVIVVRWTRPEGNVASIKIRYGKQSDLSDAITYDTAAAVDGSTIFNQNAKILHGMTLSSTYYFQLIAVDALGNESEASEIKHKNSSPNVVTNISTSDADGNAKSVGAYNSKVKINWTNPAGTTISKVRVYYKQSSTFTNKTEAGVKSFDSVSETSGSAEITPSATTMVPGYKYYIKVAAIDDEGSEGKLSTESVLYTVTPSPIGISEVVPTGTGSVTVKWVAPAGDAGVTKYELYYGQNINSLIKANLNKDTDTFADITGLVPGTYFYRVDMVSNGITVRGDAMSGGVIRPQAPVISAVTVKSSTSVEVTWTKVNNINGYKLYYGTEDDFTKMTMTSFGNSQIKTTVNSLTPGTTYYFRLISWSGQYTAPDANNAAIGESVTATTTPAAASITSVSSTTSGATVNWTAPSTGSYSGFKILYSTSTDAVGSMTVLTNDFASTVRSATLSGLIAGTRYYFRVLTYTGTYTSPTASNVSVSSSFEKYTTPNKPTISSVTTTTTSATVSWTNPAGNKTGYYLYYGTTDSIASMTKWTTGFNASATSGTITGLTAGTNYYFRVVSYAGTYSSATADNAAYSASSDKYTVTNKLTSFTQTASSTDEVTVSWTYGAGGHVWWDMYKKDVTAGETNWTQGGSYSSGTGTGWYAGSSSTVTSTRLTGLIPGHHYKILMYVSNNYWTSSISESDCTIIDVYTRPNAVTFSAAASSYYCNDITVSWTNPTGNYDGVKILYSTDGGTNWYVKATYTNKTTTTYTATNFTPGTKYLIKVASYVGTWSGEDQYNVNTNTYSINAYTIPDGPTHILAYRTSKRTTPIGSTKIFTTYYTNLKWTAPTSGDYDGYYLYYGTDPAAVISATASSSVTKVTLDKTATSYNGGWNTDYYYKLVTYKVLDGTTYESPTFYNGTVKKYSTASGGELRTFGNLFYSKYFTSSDAVWNTTLSAYYFKMSTPDPVTHAYIEVTKNDGNSWYWTNHGYTLSPGTDYGFYIYWETPGAGYTHAWLVPSYTYNTNYIFRGFMTSSSPIEMGTSTFGRPSSTTSQMNR